MYEFIKEYNSYFNKQNLWVDSKKEGQMKAIPFSRSDNAVLFKTENTYIENRNGELFLCNFYRRVAFTNFTMPSSTSDLLQKDVKHRSAKIHKNSVGYYIVVDGLRHFLNELEKNFVIK